MSIFNKRLKDLLKHNGLSQAELGRIASIPRTTIADYVNGKSSPKHDNLIKLSTALNVDLEYLTGASDIKNKDEEKYMDYLVSEYQDLEELIKETSPHDMKFIKEVVETNNQYRLYHDNVYREIVEILGKMNELDLKDLRAYAKYRLDNPR